MSTIYSLCFIAICNLLGHLNDVGLPLSFCIVLQLIQLLVSPLINIKWKVWYIIELTVINMKHILHKNINIYWLAVSLHNEHFTIFWLIQWMYGRNLICKGSSFEKFVWFIWQYSPTIINLWLILYSWCLGNFWCINILTQAEMTDGAWSLQFLYRGCD